MRRARGPWVALLLPLLVTTLLATSLAGCGKESTTPERLPDLTLRGFAGHPDVDLGTLRGPAVVNLWASWCGPCKRELPLYAAFARTYDGKVSVLGIDWQETRADAARALAERSHVGYPLVEDPQGRLRAVGLPKLVLVDAEGRIAYQEYVEIKSAEQLESLVEKHLGVSR